MHDCSYEAAEENEVSFLEGERIVEIEAVSDDWWQGKTADGRVGLFPGMFLLTLATGSFAEVLVMQQITWNFTSRCKRSSILIL